MDQYIFDKLIIEPILFYKSLLKYGYVFDKNIEKYFIGKNNLIANKKLQIDKLNNILTTKKQLNLQPFIVILLSLDRQYLKNIYRHILTKWKIYKSLENNFANKTFNLPLGNLNNLDQLIDCLQEFLSVNKWHDRLVFFILNTIQNYFYPW